MVARDDYMSNAGEQLLLRGVTQLSSPAMGYSADVYACLANDAASLYTVYQGTARRVWQSTALTAPSFDAYGWVWAADGEGIVRAFKPDSEDATERERGVDIGLSWQLSLIHISRSPAWHRARPWCSTRAPACWASPPSPAPTRWTAKTFRKPCLPAPQPAPNSRTK